MYKNLTGNESVHLTDFPTFDASAIDEQLNNDTRGKFGGIGIIVSQENDKLIIVSPIEDTPAMKAGLKSGDEIIQIEIKTAAFIVIWRHRKGIQNIIFKGINSCVIAISIK